MFRGEIWPVLWDSRISGDPQTEPQTLCIKTEHFFLHKHKSVQKKVKLEYMNYKKEESVPAVELDLALNTKAHGCVCYITAHCKSNVTASNSRTVRARRR